MDRWLSADAAEDGSDHDIETLYVLGTAKNTKGVS
jgi:hypothetical protein